MGDQWAAPIWVAIIAGFATVVGAFLNSKKETKDNRARILKDIEILKALPDDVFINPVILQAYLQRRIDRLAVEETEATSRKWLVAGDLIGLVVVASIMATLTSHKTEVDRFHWPLWGGILMSMGLAVVLALRVYQYMHFPKRNGDRALKVHIEARDEAFEKLKTDTSQTTDAGGPETAGPSAQ